MRQGSLPTVSGPEVLILGDHFGYPGAVRHGATSYFLNTLPVLVRRGVSVRACFLREPHPAAEALQACGVVPTFLSAPKWDASVAVRVAAAIRSQGAQLVHAAGVKATLVARMAARMVETRVIVHAHDLLAPSSVLGLGHRLFARSDDRGIGVSGAARDVIIAGYHVRPDRATVIHNGIDVQRMRRASPLARSRLRTELKIPERGAALALIARMHPIKGHRAMLRILAEVLRRCPETVLLLAGDGPERAPCERLAAELDIAHAVRFLGNRDDVPELLAASDLVVVPSELEGLPTVAIEAAAAGRAVVGFASGGLDDIVEHGRTGFLIRCGDEQGFALAITDLLNSRDRLRAMGAAGEQGSARFSIDAHVDQLIACYAEALAPAPPPMSLRARTA